VLGPKLLLRLADAGSGNRHEFAVHGELIRQSLAQNSVVIHDKDRSLCRHLQTPLVLWALAAPIPPRTLTPAQPRHHAAMPGSPDVPAQPRTHPATGIRGAARSSHFCEPAQDIASALPYSHCGGMTEQVVALPVGCSADWVPIVTKIGRHCSTCV